MSKVKLETDSSVLATLRGMPRAAVLLMVGVTVNRMGSFVQLYLILYLTQIGFQPAQAGIALTAYGIGALCGIFLGGTITDKVGPRLTISISMLTCGVQLGLLPFIHHYLLLVLLCAGAGTAAQAYLPAASSMLAAVTPSHRLVMVSAVYRLALNIGAVLGPLIGAALAALSYRLVFLTDMSTCFLFGLIALAWLPHQVATHGADYQNASYRTVLRDRRYLLVVGALVFMAMVEIQYLVTLPLQMKAWGFSTTLYSIIIAINALLVILFELPLTQVVQTWPIRGTIATGIALITTGIVLYGIPGGVLLLVIATIIRTLGEIAAAPSLTAYPALVAPGSARGRYIAAMGAAQSIGYAIGPALGAVLFQFAGWSAWTTFAILGAVGVILAISGVRQPKLATNHL